MAGNRETALKNLAKADKTKLKGRPSPRKGMISRLAQGWAEKGLEGEILRSGGVPAYFEKLHREYPADFNKMVREQMIKQIRVENTGEQSLNVRFKNLPPELSKLAELITK